MNKAKFNLFIFILSAAGLFLGCPTDSQAPSAPELDPIATVTSLGLVSVSGRAEYLATVEIQDQAETVKVTADSQTGRFAAELALVMGENTIKVVAIDAAGQRSKPSTVVVVREQPRAESIRIALEQSIVDADQAQLAVQVQVFNDESEVSLAGLGVSLSVAHYPLQIAPLSVILDSEGRGRALVTGLTAVGSGEIVASATMAGADGSLAQTSAGFAVLSGAVTEIELLVSADLDSGPVGPASSISVPVDSDVQCQVTVFDAQGNSIDNAPVALAVQGGDAEIFGRIIRNLRRAGTYRVVASEGLLASEAQIFVQPGAGARIQLQLSAAQISAGQELTATAQIFDTFDNLVLGASPSLVHDVPATDLLGDPQNLSVSPVDGGVVGSMAIRSAGQFEFVAAFGTLAPAQATVLVQPGLPANGQAHLNPDPLAAGEILVVTADFEDAFKNPVEAEFSLACDAPGAMVMGHQVFGIMRANEGQVPYHLLIGAAGGTVVTQELWVVAAPASKIVVGLSANLVEAGTAVTVQAEFQDPFGNRVWNMTPEISIDSPEDFSPLPVSEQGLTTGQITLTTAGNYQVTASESSGLLDSVSAPLQVQAGSPVNQNFFEIDPAGVPYKAGDPVAFYYNFVDAYGNANTSTPILVSVNAPNVIVTDDGFGAGEINGLIRSGNYTVRARAVGTGLNDDSEIVTIDPNPQNAGFNLTLSAGLIAEGGTALFFVVDGFGNSVDLGDLSLTVSDPSITVSENRLHFALPGTYQISACLVADAQICDTEFIGVQGIVDTVPPQVSVQIVAPDPLLTDQVSARGIVSYRVQASDDRNLSKIDVVANFGEQSGGCTAAQGPVLFAGGTSSETLNFSLQIPRCALPLDRVSIVARAQDESGNTRNSAAHTDLTIRAPLNISISASGFLLSFAAWQDRIADNPYDVAASPLTSELYVSVLGRDRIIVVPQDRQQYDLRDAQSNNVRPQGPTGMAFDGIGNLFFNAQDVGNNDPGLGRVRPDLIYDSPFIDRSIIANAFPAEGVGLAIDQSDGLVPLLCSAVATADKVQCFDAFSDSNATPSMVINQGILGSPRAVAFWPASAQHNQDILWVLVNNVPALQAYQFSANRDSMSLVQEISLSSEVGSGECGDIVVAPVTNNIILSHSATGRILRIDPVSGAISVLATGFDQPQGLAWDGSSLLVVDQAAGAVVRIVSDPANPGIF